MANRLLILGTCLFSLSTTACRVGKGPTPAACTAEYGQVNASNYIFKSHNYSCEDDPIEDAFKVDASDIASKLSTAGGAPTTTEIFNDVDEAISGWLAADAAWDLNYVSASAGDEADPLSNGYNQFDIVDDVDPYPDGDNALAYTSSTDSDGDGTTDQCDIIFYTTRETDNSTITWSVDATPAGNEADLAYVLAHEMGHCIGIGDQTDGSTAGDLMYASYSFGTDFVSIATHDEEAILWIYGPNP